MPIRNLMNIRRAEKHRVCSSRIHNLYQPNQSKDKSKNRKINL